MNSDNDNITINWIDPNPTEIPTIKVNNRHGTSPEENKEITPTFIEEIKKDIKEINKDITKLNIQRENKQYIIQEYYEYKKKQQNKPY